MSILVTLITFLAVLGVLVLIHELGHFAMAKLHKVQVLEFGLGFPPRLVGKRFGETLYSFNLIPLGGFVKMTGEEDPTHPRSLAGKSAWVRFLILTAGPFMNVLLPVLLFTIVFMVPQQMVVGQVAVQQVVSDSPAQRAGVQTGDIILKADGRPVENNRDLAYLISLKLGAKMDWLIDRGGRTHLVTLVPRFRPPEGQGATGVQIQTTNLRQVSHSEPFWDAIPLATRRVGEVMVLVKNEVTRWIMGSSTPQVAGPIGIAQITGEVRQSGIIPIIEFTAFLSIMLAITNILPIPALDGGRLLFVGIELARRGKRIPPEKEGLVHLIGFAFIISLIVLISYYDVVRIFRGESLLG